MHILNCCNLHKVGLKVLQNVIYIAHGLPVSRFSFSYGNFLDKCIMSHITYPLPVIIVLQATSQVMLLYSPQSGVGSCMSIFIVLQIQSTVQEPLWCTSFWHTRSSGGSSPKRQLSSKLQMGGNVCGCLQSVSSSQSLRT